MPLRQSFSPDGSHRVFRTRRLICLDDVVYHAGTDGPLGPRIGCLFATCTKDIPVELISEWDELIMAVVAEVMREHGGESHACPPL